MKKLGFFIIIILMFASCGFAQTSPNMTIGEQCYADIYITSTLKIEESYVDLNNLTIRQGRTSVSMVGAVYVDTWWNINTDNLYGTGVAVWAAFGFVYPSGKIVDIICQNYDATGIYSTTYTFNPWKFSTEKFHSILSCRAEETLTGNYIGQGILDVKAVWNEKRNTISATGKFTSGDYFAEIVNAVIPMQLVSIPCF
jgi:hypothetical protein